MATFLHFGIMSTNRESAEDGFVVASRDGIAANAIQLFHESRRSTIASNFFILDLSIMSENGESAEDRFVVDSRPFTTLATIPAKPFR
jgi:hypothetical protein